MFAAVIGTDWLIDWLIDWIVFFTVSAIFQPHNGGETTESSGLENKRNSGNDDVFLFYLKKPAPWNLACI